MVPDKKSFDKRYNEKDYKFNFKYDEEILRDILKYKKSGKVLDLGCGEAGLSLELAKKNFEVTAVDISKKAIDEIKKEAKKKEIKIKSVCSDLENYEISENYDVILALGILQFLGENGKKYLEKIQSHTKKGGINIIDAFVNKWLPRNKLKEIYSNWKIMDYEKYKQKSSKWGEKWMNYLVAKNDLII